MAQNAHLPPSKLRFFAIARLVLSSLATYLNSLLYIFDSEDTPVFADGIAICHAGNVIRHGTGTFRFFRKVELRRQQARIACESQVQVTDNTTRFGAHTHNTVMPV
jgi:hypothetical protein